MSKILIDEAVVRQALEALESGDWYINQLEMIVYSPDDDGTHEEREKVQKAITALREALAEQKSGIKQVIELYDSPEQPAPAHCEAGPEYCQQCCKESFEDRSLALAAAVRYVKNNTPNLVWTEIERALTAPQAQPAGYAKKIESLIVERDALKAKLAEQPAQQVPVAMYEDWYASNSCGHCGMVGGHANTCRHYASHTTPGRTASRKETHEQDTD